MERGRSNDWTEVGLPLHRNATVGLRYSLSISKEYGYDGDEGNINKPPDYASRSEIRHLLGCWNNIIGAQLSKPWMGILYNGITSAYLLSQRTEAFSDADWDEAMSKLTARNYVDANPEFKIPSLDERMIEQYGEVRRNGPALFSALLPPDFNYKKGEVHIEHGILLKGKLKEGHVGPASDSIVHVLHHRYTKRHAARFITEAQFVLDWHIEMRGFSVNYADCAPSGAIQAQVTEVVKTAMAKAQGEIDAQNIDFDNETDRLYFEAVVQAALGNVRTIGNQIVTKALPADNPLRVMAESGAKGSVINVAQITGIIGQQFLKGKRPELALNADPVSGRMRRFLAYYDVNDHDISTRGFIDRSFDQGMRPGQFVAHMMASRLGVIDMALGTAKTGHLHRVVNKTLEDTRIGYNGSICNSLGVIFNYISWDGYDAIALVPANSPGTGPVSSPVNFEALANHVNATAVSDW